MYSFLNFYQLNKQVTCVALPFETEKIIQDWNNLRTLMSRNLPEKFTRDEWAYLITFLDKKNLYEPIKSIFGNKIPTPENKIKYLARPRGKIALWLPNNVSLLGPIMLVLCSLSGCPMRIKCGSHSESLTDVFLNFLLDNLPKGQLKTFLECNIILENFDRNDPRNQEMAATSDIRIVFGSDEAARAINSMPHPVESISFSFKDRQSEAWVEKQALDNKTISDLIKVFAIYGQAGCTSPKRVVIINGKREDAIDLKNKIIKAWPIVINYLPFQHIASTNIMARQLAAAWKWEAAVTEMNSAVIAAGSHKNQSFYSLMLLPIVCATAEEAIVNLPQNIQTIGYALKDPNDNNWLTMIANTKIKRFVPIRQMHHFGHVWDGYDFWGQLFEKVEVVL